MKTEHGALHEAHAHNTMRTTGSVAAPRDDTAHSLALSSCPGCPASASQEPKLTKPHYILAHSPHYILLRTCAPCRLQPAPGPPLRHVHSLPTSQGRSAAVCGAVQRVLPSPEFRICTCACRPDAGACARAYAQVSYVSFCIYALTVSLLALMACITFKLKHIGGQSIRIVGRHPPPVESTLTPAPGYAPRSLAADGPKFMTSLPPFMEPLLDHSKHVMHSGSPTGTSSTE